jgi:hypothetical protein
MISDKMLASRVGTRFLSYNKLPELIAPIAPEILFARLLAGKKDCREERDGFL